MDIFIEYIVKKQKTGLDYLKMLGIVVATLFLWMLVLLFNHYLFGLGLFIIAGIGWGAWKLLQTTSLEYEYILTNAELDIDKIIARTRRKRVLTVNFKEILLCARVDDPMFKAEFNNTSNVVKTYDVAGNNGQKYFVEYNGEGGKIRVLFTPNEKIMESVKKLAPRTVNL